MRLGISLLFGLGAMAAGLSASAAQAQANPAKCSLPPPLVCPPEPPPGPRTAEQLDKYLEGVDNAVASLGSVPGRAWTASPGATAGFIAYADELKEYRQQVADYRDKISPDFAYGQDAAEVVSGPQ